MARTKNAGKTDSRATKPRTKLITKAQAKQGGKGKLVPNPLARKPTVFRGSAPNPEVKMNQRPMWEFYEQQTKHLNDEQMSKLFVEIDAVVTKFLEQNQS